jgi:cell division transport system ATP-binding protein
MIKLESVSKKYKVGTAALTDISFFVDKGEFVFLVGPSGSGKTTLFRLLIKDAVPSEGRIHIGDWDLARLPSGKIPHLRKKIGMVFQDLKLLKDRTVFENILFPLEVSDIPLKIAKQKVEKILEDVGISEHKNKFPLQLSGGELQRVAIARALVFNPDIILADEPTADLDMTTTWEILKLLQDINKAGTTIIMATHNTDIINSLLKRVITLQKGKMVKDENKHAPNSPKNDTLAKKTEENKEKEQK